MKSVIIKGYFTGLGSEIEKSIADRGVFNSVFSNVQNEYKSILKYKKNADTFGFDPELLTKYIKGKMQSMLNELQSIEFLALEYEQLFKEKFYNLKSNIEKIL